ncbi:putative PLD-regulated protein1 [Dioscorea sansibarensis]
MAPFWGGRSREDEAVDDFDDYDPTPYGGGYDLALTYGRPLPPSEEICHSVSSSETIDYERPHFSSGSTPSVYECEYDYGDRYGQASQAKPQPAYGVQPVQGGGGSVGYGGGGHPGYGGQSEYGSGYGSEQGSGYGGRPGGEEGYGPGYGGRGGRQEEEGYGSGYGGRQSRQEDEGYGSGYGRKPSHQKEGYGSGYGGRPSRQDDEGYRSGYGGRSQQEEQENPSYGFGYGRDEPQRYGEEEGGRRHGHEGQYKSGVGEYGYGGSEHQRSEEQGYGGGGYRKSGEEHGYGGRSSYAMAVAMRVKDMVPRNEVMDLMTRMDERSMGITSTATTPATMMKNEQKSPVLLHCECIACYPCITFTSK